MFCRQSRRNGGPSIQLIERPPSVRKVMGSNPIGTQIFSKSHARVTLFSHIFTELQFHHHSFITLGLLSFFFRMRCFKRLQRCTSTIKKNCNTRYEDYCHRLEKPAENQAMLYIQQYLIATEGHCCACYSCDH